MDINKIKQLREQTSAGIADCRKALEATNGDLEKAADWLKKHGIEKAEKKSDRETATGLIETYVHSGKIGVLVELLCETDFVARTDDFKNLAHELAMQISAMNPKNAAALLKQAYIRDQKLTIQDLIKSVIAKVGENIKVGKFTRLALGE